VEKNYSEIRSANADNSKTVNSELVGEVCPMAVPAEDPVLYGQAELTPEGAFQVRSYQTFTLTYKVGRFGLDDNGSIRVVFRFFGDWGERAGPSLGDAGCNSCTWAGA